MAIAGVLQSCMPQKPGEKLHNRPSTLRTLMLAKGGLRAHVFPTLAGAPASLSDARGPKQQVQLKGIIVGTVGSYSFDWIEAAVL